jgi:hypothetical protein
VAEGFFVTCSYCPLHKIEEGAMWPYAPARLIIV